VRNSERRNLHPSGTVIDSQARKGSGVGGSENAGTTMGPTVHPVANANCWCTQAGWCSVHESMPQACTTETVGGGFSMTN
jgi:hypothetical protein